MRVVYTGPFDEVEVPALNLLSRRGVPVEVTADVGARLCEQSCWERAGTRAPNKENE